MNKPLGKYTLREIKPIIEVISKEFNLKPSRVKEFQAIKKLIAIRYITGDIN